MPSAKFYDPVVVMVDSESVDYWPSVLGSGLPFHMYTPVQCL